MTEHDNQKLLIDWFRFAFPKLTIFAIPNGGKRNIGTAIKLKKEGVLAGIPDLFVAVPKDGIGGLFIEMKSASGRLQNSQKSTIDRLVRAGYRVAVCYGYEEAKQAILDYFNKDYICN